jgi:hypothetical protein
VVSCARTCQELLKHAMPLLLVALPGLDLTRLGSENASLDLYGMTGRESDKQLGTGNAIRKLSGVRALSLHISTYDHDSLPGYVDESLQYLTSTLAKSKILRALTVTPSTRFYKDDHFDQYETIAKGQHNIQFICLPPKLIDADSNPGEFTQISAWIQKDPPPTSGTSLVSRSPDLFLEKSTRISTAVELSGSLEQVYGLSFMGQKGSKNLSLSGLCRSLGLQEGLPLQSLRFANLEMVKVSQLSKLGNFTTLELHDIKDPDGILSNLMKSAKQLRRFVLSYSGYPDNGRLAELKPKVGKSLRQIVVNNINLEELCIQVNSVHALSAEQLISDLPSTIKLLHVTSSESEFFGPKDYALLAAKCPSIRGIGATMHFTPASKTPYQQPMFKLKCEQIITGLRKMPDLAYVTVQRFDSPKKYRAEDLANIIYKIAKEQDIDEGVINLDDIKELKFKPIISVHLRQSSYRRAQPCCVGNHFMVEEPKTIVKFEPTLQTMIKDLICLSASFGRTMTEFAAAESVRYQYEGPHDVETEVGWTSGPESLVKV